MNATFKQREARASVIIKALVRPPLGKESERRVRNLTPAGACIDHAGDLAEGDGLSLDIGTLTDVAAKVIWTREAVAGVRFAEEIDLNQAKKSRGVGVSVASGWLAGLKDAYR